MKPTSGNNPSSCLVLAAILVLCLAPAAAEAAELTGRISLSDETAHQAQDMRVRLACPQYDNAVGVANGSYTLRGLPANSACELTVEVNNLVSKPIRIQTNASLVRFNAEVRLLDNRLIVLRR